MSVMSIVVAFLVLLAVGMAWFVMYYFNNPVLEDPDGIGRIVGSCGDTMEIALKFHQGKVIATHHWTNGCSFSKRCVEAAAGLAEQKTVQEVQKVNMVAIMDEIGKLPDTHLHCAELAELTLQKSLNNYLVKSVKNP